MVKNMSPTHHSAANPPSQVPLLRVHQANQAPIRADADFVLYWMIANRRTEWNYSLQRAVDWAIALQKPLIIFEPLRVDYPWASDRLHSFILQGMADNAQRVAKAKCQGVLYYPYVEPTRGADQGLLATLAKDACLIVTDDFPCFFLPRMLATVAPKLPVRLECVDSNGLLPLRATERVFTTAFSFRAYLQKELPNYLCDAPAADPLSKLKLPVLSSLPVKITQRWPTVAENLLTGSAAALAVLPIDHSVSVVSQRGGSVTARRRLHDFLQTQLDRYDSHANDPDADSRSGLSPYLHFGHLSAHEILHELIAKEDWSPMRLSKTTGGKREGWWGASASAEAWLDEFVTWRELGYNMSSHCDNYQRYESLPDWSRATLEKHANDPRTWRYSLDTFTAATTHDKLWNAAQTQLLREGRIHNYLRMLWGKKILEWSSTPQEALDTMIELNNRYALDGRNPNSYSGIFWCLGRYDRAWGPERPIFGTVRYMSSDNTARKLNIKRYLSLYGNNEH
jgi:deoxyribodipyrimidine photo-lyase